jgi:putative ABC transport system ATP-binding protein
MPVIEARELYRFFHTGNEEVKALRGVDLVLEEGKMVALVGPSGSGKSTLLMCLAGLDEPDGGSVAVMNAPMTRRPESEKLKLRARYLGVMRQKDNLFPHLTVMENIQLAQSFVDRSALVNIDNALERIGMAARKNSLPPQLSGGERARAGVAIAMACRPAALLLDEPTGEVDAETEAAILAVFEDYRREGGSIVVATHNPSVARMADRTFSMKDGRVANA